MGNRKKPFSNKQKKVQIQAKRTRKRAQAAEDADAWDFNKQNLPDYTGKAVPAQPVAPSAAVKNALTAAAPSRNKLTSQFDKLTRQEIDANKKRSMLPLRRLTKEDGLTMSFENAYSADVDIPVRPPWSYELSREALERREEAYFGMWLEKIQKLKDMDSVSLYEKNLEVWRQLWRVVEISDILLLVVDIRHPVLHFPPSLYRYISETTGKPIVVVLNKTDLVAASTVKAWKRYFKEKFPAITLTSFGCYRNSEVILNDTNVCDLKLRRKKPRKRVYDSSQVSELLAACRQVCVAEKRDLVQWDSLIARYRSSASEQANELTGDSDNDSDADADANEEEDGESDSGSDSESEGEQGGSGAAEPSQQPTLAGHIETVSSKYVTLGLVGHPNVGKSTVINSIMGRTVVSASRTPGHTKHFQTIHVTPTLRLCDCPGLVFPCVIERPLQILAGLYNTAQVQEPFTCVMYLAERVPVERVLSLEKLEPTPLAGDEWSAWAICEAFAIDRGYYTSKAARPDVYRAALDILKWELDGRILLSFKPPSYFSDHSYLMDDASDNYEVAGDQQGSQGVKQAEHGNDAGESPQDESEEDEDTEDESAPVGQQSAFAILSSLDG